MLPIHLKIKGLYSYKSKQNIDFTSLLEGQLFGIFGAVGSGKTAVLEAMTLALFNQSERLGRNDDKAYNIMNLQSNELLIEFEFEEKGDQYLFKVTAKRNRNTFEKVKPERKAYQLKNGEYEPLEDGVTAEKIIGLSYDNFKRTVIIPQGKFQDFIQLTGTDRTRMFKELFHLHKFELDHARKSLYIKNKSGLDVLEGQLSLYNEYSKERLKEEKEELNVIKKQLLELKKEFEQVQLKKTELEKLQKLTLELASLENRLKVLLQQKTEIENLETRLQKYQFYYSKYAILLNTIKNTQKEVKSSNSHKKELAVQLENIQSLFNKELEKFELAKSNFEKNPELESKAKSIARVQEVLQKQSELQTQKERISNGEQAVEKEEKVAAKLDKEINDLESQVGSDKFKSLEDDAYEFWFELLSEAKQIESQLESSQRRLKSLEADLVQQKEKEKIILGEYKSSKAIEAALKELGEKEIGFRSSLEQSKVSLRLAAYTEGLKSGDPCPVCGALDHPKAKNESDNTHDVEEIEASLVTLEKDKGGLNDSLFKYSIESKLVLEKESHHQILLKEIEGSQAQLSALLEKSVKQKKGVNSISAIEEELNQIKVLKQELEKIKSSISTCSKELKSAQENIAKYKEYVQKFKDQCRDKENEIKFLKAEVEDQSLYELSVDQLKDLHSKLLIEIAENESLIKSSEKEIKRLEANRISVSTELEVETRKLEGLNESLNKENGELAKFLDEDAVELEEVELVLAEKIDIQQSTSIIQEYKSQLSVIQSNITSVSGELGDKKVNHEELSEITKYFENIHSNLENLKEKNVEKSNTVSQIEQKLAEQKELFSKQDALRKRQELLKDFEKLFKASGFVNFVSGVKLHELCNEANKRFYHLTKQRMRLEVDENNNFCVRDFYNEGQSRSVKTLSGGQTFQASLCLALALAEMIQVQNNNQQNFFFLDEGFGTLDKDSLGLVFETLKSLRKEGRVVGVISHVEELKDEIDRYLQIENNSGESIIQNNWLI